MLQNLCASINTFLIKKSRAFISYLDQLFYNPILVGLTVCTTNPFRQFLQKGEDLPLPLSKIEELPVPEDKRSLSKINKKRSSKFMKKLTTNNKEKIITKSSQQACM